MKICIMSCFEDFLSRDTGYNVRIYNLAENLVKLGCEVHLVIPGEKDETKILNGILVHKIKGLFPLHFLTIFNKIFHIEKVTSFYFYDILFILKALKIILNCHIVQFEQPWSGVIFIPFIKFCLNKLIVIDSHDVFQSLRLPNTNFTQKIIMTFFEKLSYNFGNLIFVVSHKEKNLLIKYGYLGKHIFIVPNGVNTNIFYKYKKTDVFLMNKFNPTKFINIIFIGNMGYFPNQEAVDIITFKIAPTIYKTFKNVNFIIVGKCPNKIQISKPYIIYTEVVENVVDYLNISTIAIAPLFHGSGTRLKILEYFSVGLPVVSTSIGAEGLDVKNGENIIIEDNIIQFSKRVIELIKNESLRIKMGKKARELVINKYEWFNIVKNVLQYYHNGYDYMFKS